MPCRKLGTPCPPITAKSLSGYTAGMIELEIINLAYISTYLPIGRKILTTLPLLIRFEWFQVQLGGDLFSSHSTFKLLEERHPSFPSHPLL